MESSRPGLAKSSLSISEKLHSCVPGGGFKQNLFWKGLFPAEQQDLPGCMNVRYMWSQDKLIQTSCWKAGYWATRGLCLPQAGLASEHSTPHGPEMPLAGHSLTLLLWLKSLVTWRQWAGMFVLSKLAKENKHRTCFLFCGLQWCWDMSGSN